MKQKTLNPKAVAVGRRIRALREQFDFTTAELGGMVGVTENAVTQYETGRTLPRPQRLEALAVALQTNVIWLLTGNEPDELVRAQTANELDALRILREVPFEQQAAAIAALEGIARAFAKK